MNQKNVLIMAWGKTLGGDIYKRQKVKFPTECPIFLSFDISKSFGKASNFKNTRIGITCDVEYIKKFSNTLAPTFECIITKNREIKDLKLRELSFIMVYHSMMKCHNNLKVKQ